MLPTYTPCHNPLCQMTPRQKELLGLVINNPGATNYELSLQMGVSERTVKRYLSDVYRIVGVQNRSECLFLLIQHGQSGVVM